MLKSAKNFILVSFVVFFSHLMFGDFLWGQDTLWQRDWYMGEGQDTVHEIWNYRYFSSINLNTLNHYIAFMSNSVDYSRWEMVEIQSVNTGDHYQFPIPCDLDGDNFTDFITLNSSGDLFWCEDEGRGFECHCVLSLSRPPGYGPSGECIDVDDDGYNDILLAFSCGLYVLWGNGDGTFEIQLIDSTFSYHRVVASDFNNDGFCDIVGATGRLRGNLVILYGDGLRNFSSPLVVSNFTDHTWRIIPVDFDYDGFIDLICSNYDFLFAKNRLQSDGNFQVEWRIDDDAYCPWGDFDGLSVADFNRDGFQDAIAAFSDCSGILIALNDGAGSILRTIYISDYPLRYGDGTISDDIDFDGDYDFIGVYSVLGLGINNGDGTFSYYDIYNIVSHSSHSHWVKTYFDNSICSAKKNLVTRVDDGYLLFKNNMIIFEGMGNLISSALHLPEAKKPVAFGWRDCVPEGFEVRYYYRTGATFEECTSSDWTLLAYSGDSVDGVCGGWFQYKIEFERLPNGDSTLSPRVDGVFLTVSSCYECEQMPNPFTPNNDQVNDVVNFHFPQLGFEHAKIQIFNLHGRLIRTIDVPKGSMAVKYSCWDGTDEDGNPLPPGLYVYIITSRGELVCEGTVTLAR